MFEGFVFDGHIVIASGKNAPECHLHFLSFYGCLQIRLQFHVKHFKCEYDFNWEDYYPKTFLAHSK